MVYQLFSSLTQNQSDSCFKYCFALFYFMKIFGLVHILPRIIVAPAWLYGVATYLTKDIVYYLINKSQPSARMIPISKILVGFRPVPVKTKLISSHILMIFRLEFKMREEYSKNSLDKPLPILSWYFNHQSKNFIIFFKIWFSDGLRLTILTISDRTNIRILLILL